jgi:predicted RNA-binding Zn ribbon-like protein
MYYVRFKDPDAIDVTSVAGELRAMTVLEQSQASRLSAAMADMGALVDSLMARTIASVLGERVLLTDDLPVFVHALKDADDASGEEVVDEAELEAGGEAPATVDFEAMLASFKPVGRAN